MWIWILITIIVVFVIWKQVQRKDVASTLSLAELKHDQLRTAIQELFRNKKSLKALPGSQQFLEDLNTITIDLRELAIKFANSNTASSGEKTKTLFDLYKFNDYCINGLSTITLGKHDFPKFREKAKLDAVVLKQILGRG